MQKLSRRIIKFGKDLPKLGNIKNLSLLSVESIIPYIDPVKRLFLSLTYPRFSKIEKRLPLELSKLEIRSYSMTFEKMDITIKNGEIRFFNPMDFRHGRRSKALNYVLSYFPECKEDVLEVVFALFGGRTNLRIICFRSEIEIPFDLNIDVSKVLVFDSFQKVARYCGNVFRKIDNATFYWVHSPDDLRHSWIQTSERLDILHGKCAALIAELPNLRAKQIYIKSNCSLADGFKLIKAWIKNRRTDEGAKIYITFRYEAGAYQLFHWHGLREMGFAGIDENRLRISLGNYMEARIAVRFDKEHFHGDCWSEPQYDYLSIEIVNSECC